MIVFVTAAAPQSICNFRQGKVQHAAHAQLLAAAVSHTLPPTPSKQPRRTYLLTCPLMEEMVRARMVRCIGLQIEEAKVANLDLLCEKLVVNLCVYQILSKPHFTF